MAKHHEFSPSKLEQIAACPWSYRNCLNWNEETDDAARGTLLHAAIYDETAYAQLSDRDRGMIDFIRAEHVNAKPYDCLEKHHELPVQIVRDGIILSEGILDFLIISADGKAASIKDWKFGGYEVAPADENLQIKAYVCGVFNAFPLVETVYAMVVQPVYGSADYDRQAAFSREQYPAMLDEIAAVIDRAKAATEENACPSAASCRYCNKLACRAFRAKMDRNFEIFAIDPAQLAEPEKAMTVDFADRLLCARREIESIMESKTAAAKKLIIANGGSDNFRVQAGRIAKRTDWKKLVEKYEIPQSEIDAVTTATEGEPYLMPKMRRKPTAAKQLSGGAE